MLQLIGQAQVWRGAGRRRAIDDFAGAVVLLLLFLLVLLGQVHVRSAAATYVEALAVGRWARRFLGDDIPICAHCGGRLVGVGDVGCACCV